MKKILALLLSTFLINVTIAQEGEIDLTFDPGVGFDHIVYATVIQSDGKILVGGSFKAYNGALRNGLVRLNSDGTLDTEFSPELTHSNGNDYGYNVINSIAIQSDGKILIGGFFTHVGGVFRRHLARLNPDGSIDNSFSAGLQSSLDVTSIAIQSDGKILVVGDFNYIGGISRNKIARLNSDGTADESFDPGTGFSEKPGLIVVESDGKILVGTGILGASITSYNGTTRKGLVRLNPDGSIANFGVVTSNYNSLHHIGISAIAVQEDGKIIVSGSKIVNSGDYTTHFIERRNTNGSIDNTFSGILYGDGSVASIIIQSNGKILIGGYFSGYNSVPRNKIARINLDGSLDQTFNPGTGFNYYVFNLSVQSDGKIIAGGAFGQYNDITRNRITRINSNHVVGVEALTPIDFSIYPNPTNSSFTISNAPHNADLFITDLTGKIIYQSVVSVEEKIDVSSFTNGVYFVNVEHQGNRSVEKLVVGK